MKVAESGSGRTVDEEITAKRLHYVLAGPESGGAIQSRGSFSMRRLVLLALMVFFSSRALGASFSFCSEPSEGSPWYDVNKEVSPPQATGVLVDLLGEAFRRMGHQAVFRADLPWKRCLYSVEMGEVDFAFGAYFDKDRAKRFAYSKPYRLLTPQIFFTAAKPISFKSVAELKRYRGCGMLGSSYAHYGFKEGELDQGSNTYLTMISKLKNGRCDFFPEELEVIANLSHEPAAVLQDPSLRHVAAPGAIAPGRHLIAGLKQPAAKQLAQFNQVIGAMQKSGELGALFKTQEGR